MKLPLGVFKPNYISSWVTILRRGLNLAFIPYGKGVVESLPFCIGGGKLFSFRLELVPTTSSLHVHSWHSLYHQSIVKSKITVVRITSALREQWGRVTKSRYWVLSFKMKHGCFISKSHLSGLTAIKHTIDGAKIEFWVIKIHKTQY